MAASISPSWSAEPHLGQAAPGPVAAVAELEDPVRIGFGEEAGRWLREMPGEHHAYWQAVLEEGSTAFVPNLRSRPGWVRCGNSGWPLTVHDGPENNSYPASLITQYVAYPRAELGLVDGAWTRLGARLALTGLAMVLQWARADRVVQLGSWLLSTNLHGADLAGQVGRITRRLTSQFPDHAVLVRNVHGEDGQGLPQALTGAGYELATGRQSYLFDGRTAEFLRKSTVKRELKEFASPSEYHLVGPEGLGAADVPRMTELYHRLYLEKHSVLNPQYTERFVCRARREGWLEFRGLRHSSGRLDGIWGAFTSGGSTSVSFIGYDTSLPPETGLYRRLVLGILKEVAERKLLLNYSSGAGDFKRRRGGNPVIEDNALYVSHLPKARRQAFRLATRLLNRYARPWLQKSGV